MSGLPLASRETCRNGIAAGPRTGRLVEQPVEPASQADPARGGTDREQGPCDVRRRSLTGVVADRQPLALRREDDFRRDDEAGKAKRVHLGSGDGGPARLARAQSLVDGDTDGWWSHLVESLGDLSRSAARGIGFPGARVVNDFPGLQVARDLHRTPKQK